VTQDQNQPQLWRVFVPLLPWAVIFAAVYLTARPFGFGWIAFVVTLLPMGALYVLEARRRRHR
jgi:hypothetical protein